MGCLFGARLSAHADVMLIGHWPGQLEALRRAPLHVGLPDGDEQLIALRATDDPAGIGPVDAALILTKTPGTALAARGAAQVLAPDGIAVTLQNGLGNVEAIAKEVGAGRAALGTTTQGAATDGPGAIRASGGGPTHLVSRPEIAQQVATLAGLFNRAGIPTEVVDDADALIWGKLAINAAINPLTALLRVPNGALLESEAARVIMADAAREVGAVAAALGIRLPFDDPAARAEEVARVTAANRSSMLQDVLRGAPTEIDAICGAVTRIGAAHGIPTPANALLLRLVHAREDTYPQRLEDR